ncbi:glycosyltransferase family 4 protein [Polaribacter uvawellassae]|uniref:glycosyltransferase family 4 protein n=1 Tax=Polaribacter uvawellassae TaxID=3133495 RepID=UPI00321A3F89
MIHQSVLIIGTVWVEPNSSAAGSRMLQLIELFLQQNYTITFATTTQKTNNAFDLKSIGVNEVAIELNSYSFDDFIKELNPTIVVFDRFMIEEQFGWRVAENCPSAIRILDTEDLHCLRKVREEAIKKQEEFTIEKLLTSDIAKREIAAILRCDLSLIISTFEIDLLKSVFKIDENILYYLPFLLDKIDEHQTKKWKDFSKRNHFVFIGNFFHKPNIDAVITLKKHIWSAIRKAIPKAEIHIYGAYITEQIQQLHNQKEGFIVKGFVENANEVVQNAKVVLAPLRFGAGIKGKLTEAMLSGTPSVTTTIGAEGMHDNFPWNGFVEDDFPLFSKKAIALYSDKNLWNQSQKKGILIINKIYDKEKIGTQFINQLSLLQKEITQHRIQNFLGNLLQHQTLQSTKYMSKWIEEKNKK